MHLRKIHTTADFRELNISENGLGNVLVPSSSRNISPIDIDYEPPAPVKQIPYAPAGLVVFGFSIGPPIPKLTAGILDHADFRAMQALATPTGLAPDFLKHVWNCLHKCQDCAKVFLPGAYEEHQMTSGTHSCEANGSSGHGNGLGRYGGLDDYSMWSCSASQKYADREHKREEEEQLAKSLIITAQSTPSS
ncbi:hypothetical protein K439DRAFT_1613110 [Ramaria rubella]|nr:hypothetical protein K439DRAFT_1613110 [Ramaria rubella]